jgi:hypothetical protein
VQVAIEVEDRAQRSAITSNVIFIYWLDLHIFDIIWLASLSCSHLTDMTFL